MPPRPASTALGIAADTLAALVGEARGDRLVKRMIPAQAGALPAGFVRLTDDPATHLLAVIDEPELAQPEAEEPQPDAAAAVEVAAEPAAMPSEPAPAADAEAVAAPDAAVSADTGEAQPAIEIAEETTAPAVEEPVAAHHDDWYFAERRRPMKPVRPSDATVAGTRPRFR